MSHNNNNYSQQYYRKRQNKRNSASFSSKSHSASHKSKTKSKHKTKANHKNNKKERSFYGDLYSKRKLQNVYKVKEKIGSGTFSTVRRGIRRSDKAEIAIKIITKTDLNDTEFRLIEREIGIMQKVYSSLSLSLACVCLYALFD